MSKRLVKNYPLGRADVMPKKILTRRVTTHDHPGIVIGHRHTFNVRHTEQYRRDAVRTNSLPNDRPREPS